MAEKEYIERNAVIAELQEEIEFETAMYTAEQNDYFNRGLKCALKDVRRHPAADVVEVCRCKDCKHWDEKYKCCIMMGLTALGDSYFYENSFCSRGERKEATP